MREDNIPWSGPRNVFAVLGPGVHIGTVIRRSADKSDTALLIVDAVLPSARDLRLRPRSGFGSCAGGATACLVYGAGDPGQSLSTYPVDCSAGWLGGNDKAVSFESTTGWIVRGWAVKVVQFRARTGEIEQRVD